MERPSCLGILAQIFVVIITLFIIFRMIDRLWLNKRLSESQSKTLSASELVDYNKARNLIQLMVWHDTDKKMAGTR